MAVLVTDGEITCGGSLESLSINRQSVFKNPQKNKMEQAPMTRERPTKKREFGMLVWWLVGVLLESNVNYCDEFGLHWHHNHNSGKIVVGDVGILCRIQKKMSTLLAMEFCLKFL